MSLELCILASGSSGNCSVLRTPAGTMLIDLGIGPKTTAKRLEGTGVLPTDISAAYITHLDRDHFRQVWAATLIKQQIRLHCHSSKVDALLASLDPKWSADIAKLIVSFDHHPFEPLPDLTFTPIHLAHDREGSHGFVADGFGARLGYATDLGRVPPYLIQAFDKLNILAIESNYDPKMQVSSGRPAFLKSRIMGGSGHLSNEQALAAIRSILDRAQSANARLPEHIVLLHRSRQCNCPDLVRRLFERDARIGPRLTLADQFEKSPWLRQREVAPSAGEQLILAWG